jgi:hypothetical protein
MADVMRRICWVVLLVVVGLRWAIADDKTDTPSPSANTQEARAHLAEFRFAEAGAAGESAMTLSESALLTFGDAARSNESGSLWMWSRGGRPLAMIELYRPSGRNQPWVHALTATSPRLGTLDDSAGHRWTPRTSHFSLVDVPEGGPVAATPSQRLRRIKEIGRRFSAHQFWDPNNTRSELRLLVQPVLRYHDKEAHVLDGAAFVLAHGTNPEVLLQIEAVAVESQPVWKYSLIRLGSAEMHVELDGREVWTVPRTPGVVGRPEDPYWLFVTPPKATSAKNPEISP